MTTALIDADCIVYAVAYGQQIVTKWSADLWTYHAHMDPAKEHVKQFIGRLMDQTQCTSYRVVLSDTERCFRKDIMGCYKASRLGTQRPILFRPLREHFFEDWAAEMRHGLEGDDLLSMAQTEQDADTVICTLDKDANSVPGRVFNWLREDQGIQQITPYEADLFFYQQTLQGDRSDNYPGVPKIGEKTAQKLLAAWDDVDNPWDDIVVKAYEKAGLSEAVALENARCARLLRHGDVREDGAIRLWHPRGEDVWLPMQRRGQG